MASLSVLDMMKNAYIFVCNNTDCSDKVYVHQDTSDPVPEILQVALPDIEAKSIGIQLLGEEKVLSIFQVEVFGGTVLDCFLVAVIIIINIIISCNNGFNLLILFGMLPWFYIMFTVGKV